MPKPQSPSPSAPETSEGSGAGSHSGPSNAPRRGIRLWPAALIVLAGIGLSAYRWLGAGLDTQAKVMDIMAVVAGTVMALMLWLLLLSRLPWRLRLAAFGAVLALGLAFVGLFRIEGVSGNLVPILAFRFAEPAALETGSGAAEVEASPWDFGQFLGPNRNGTVDNVHLEPDWAAHPPQEIWRRPVGDAWSGFSIVGDAAITLEQRIEPGTEEAREVVARYEKTTGELVWTHAVPAVFETVVGGNGPRSTPTVHDGVVFVMGTLGTLRALDLTTGELRWSVDLVQAHGASVPSWGYAGSPLIVDLAELPRAEEEPSAGPAMATVAEGDAHSAAAPAVSSGAGAPSFRGVLVVVSPGGSEGNSLVAYDSQTGELVWAAGDDRPGYSSPSLHLLDGTPQIVVFNGTTVAGHDAASGRQLWSMPWSGDQPNVAQPLYLGENRLLISSGYGIGAAAVRIMRSENSATDDASGGVSWAVEELWRSSRMKAKFTNPVLHDGYVYGLDDGVMACLDPTTGDRCWKKGRYGHGQILLVGDLLLVQTEAGEILLLEPDPDEHRELGRIKALDGKSWNTLALSGPYLLVRNADEAVGYELALAGS